MINAFLSKLKKDNFNNTISNILRVRYGLKYNYIIQQLFEI